MDILENKLELSHTNIETNLAFVDLKKNIIYLSVNNHNKHRIDKIINILINFYELNSHSFFLYFGDGIRKNRNLPPCICLSSQREIDFTMIDFEFYNLFTKKLKIQLKNTYKKQIFFWRGALNSTQRINLFHKINLNSQFDYKFTNVEQNFINARQIKIDNKIESNFSEKIPFEEFNNYEYLINVEGSAFSWNSFLKKFLLNSVIFEYYEKNLWKHHFSDLIKDKENIFYFNNIKSLLNIKSSLEADKSLVHKLKLKNIEIINYIFDENYRINSIKKIRKFLNNH